MIALGVPRFTKRVFALHERITFSLDLEVCQVPHQPVELRCCYSEVEREQLLECCVLDRLDTPGLYRLPLAVAPPETRGRRDGILFVCALYGAHQFWQAGFFVHSGRSERAILVGEPYVVRDHSVWSRPPLTRGTVENK